MTDRVKDPWTVSAWMEGRGRTAYSAYAATVGNRTHDDKRMPKWEGLTDVIRAAWTMAALAAVAEHEAKREGN